MGICLHKVSSNSFNRFFVSDGKAIVFGPNGEYKGEVPTLVPDATFSMVDMISILQTPESVEIGYSINGEFNKRVTRLSAIDLMSIFSVSPYSPKFLGTRELNIQGVPLMQHFLMYPCNHLTKQKAEQTLRQYEAQ